MNKITVHVSYSFGEVQTFVVPPEAVQFSKDGVYIHCDYWGWMEITSITFELKAIDAAINQTKT